MPSGPLNVAVAPAVTGDVLVIPQPGSGLTVKTTSLVVKLFVQAPISVTIKRSVAVAGAPVSVTVVVKEFGELMVTPEQPATQVQFVPVVGLTPGVTVPFIVKVVVAPWVHWA